MTSARPAAHTIACNFQGIYLKHRDNRAGNPLSHCVGCCRLYVKSTTYPLPGGLVQCFMLDPKRLCAGRINVLSFSD